MRFQFIDDHRDEFPVRRMCKAPKVSPSGYYAWRGRPSSKREMANRELTDKIKIAFQESMKTYGSPHIHEVMRKHALMCRKNWVACLMRLASLRVKQTRRFRSTTKRDKAHKAAPNLLKRDFGQPI